MKSLGGVFALLVASLPSLALAQGTTASVIDLGTNTVLSHFSVGNNPAAVAWSGNTLAYIVNEDGNTLVRLDMTTSPPTITATYTTTISPHAIAINPAGTRALIAGGSTSVLLLDLTTTPFTVADTITVPILDPGGVTFYSGGSRGIIVNETNLLFLDLTVSPTGVTTVTMPNPGLAVAVNPAGTRAAVTIDTGGLQTIDLTSSPPSLIGTPVGPTAPGTDPLGVAISPNGARAIYVDESIPAPEANVVDITGTPSLVNTVPLSLGSPSAVAFNPVSAAALIRADDGVAILNPPYTAVNATILDPGFSGATTFAIAVNPAGTRAIVLNEDAPIVFAPTPTPTPPPSGPATAIPTLSPGMLGLFLLALAGAGILVMRKTL